ncbi:hypothetical protein [Methanobacterium sp.]
MERPTMSKKEIKSRKQEVDDKFNHAMDSLNFFEKIFGDKASK